MFGEVISVIVLPLLPMDSKLSLVYSVLDPVEPHVHCLGSLDLGSLVGKSVGGGIICGHTSWCSLFSTNLLEDSPDVGCLLVVVE